MRILCGSAVFNTRPDAGVSFPKPQPTPYVVVVTGDGGFQGRSGDVFFIRNKTASGFTIRAGDNNSRATVDWVAIWE